MMEFIILYLTGVIVTYGYSFGFAQTNFKLIAEIDYKRDMVFVLIISLGSWVAFIGFLFSCFLFDSGNGRYSRNPFLKFKIY